MDWELFILIVILIGVNVFLYRYYIYSRNRKYMNLKKELGDDSKTLYWNDKNLLITENYIYVDKKRYNFKDVRKIELREDPFAPFMWIKTFGFFKTKSIVSYIITFKDEYIVDVDDDKSYYKDKYLELDSLLWNYKKKYYIQKGEDLNERED